MKRSLHRLGLAFLTAFTLIGLTAGYWSILRQPELLAREDNPRLVQAEQRIQRGQILDRHDEPLATTVFEDGIAVRTYPFPGTAPVVGYYSLRYGTGGVESAYGSLLRGEPGPLTLDTFLDSLTDQPQIGGDVRLTIDLDVQQMASSALNHHTGAVVVLDVPSGRVLAMATAPTFDPNMLEDEWEDLSEDPAAPLLNRATQGLYQPGSAFQTVVLGIGLNTGTIDLASPQPGSMTTLISGTMLPCAAGSAGDGTFADAYRAACPAPFRRAGVSMGPDVLNAALADFGLYEPPPFALPVEAAPIDSPSNLTAPGLAAIGQSSLTVTPLHMARVAAAFANKGQMPPLQLIDAVRAPGQRWQVVPPPGNPRGTISPTHVETIAQLMRDAVTDGAAEGSDIFGYSVHGHAGLALTGPDETLSAWFIGFVPYSEEGSYAIAVLLENNDDAGQAARVAGQVLRSALKTGERISP